MMLKSPKYSVCLIEDHPSLGNIIQQEIQGEGYDCARYTSRDEEKIILSAFDCFILDIMIPGKDGYQICEHIRKESDAGIIFLTAKTQLRDKILGFEIGADDYITKPFEMKELLARIDALLRRTPDKHHTLSTGVHIDPQKRLILKGERSIHCTPIQWRVLLTLLEYQGTPCPRTALLEAGRGEDNLFSMNRSLDVTIANLRKKLGKGSIRTVSKVGYMIA